MKNLPTYEEHLNESERSNEALTEANQPNPAIVKKIKALTKSIEREFRQMPIDSFETVMNDWLVEYNSMDNSTLNMLSQLDKSLKKFDDLLNWKENH